VPRPAESPPIFETGKPSELSKRRLRARAKRIARASVLRGATNHFRPVPPSQASGLLSFPMLSGPQMVVLPVVHPHHSDQVAYEKRKPELDEIPG